MFVISESDGHDNKLEKSELTSPTLGVIYLSRIPHGFYEEQMRSYFGQFGTVTNLKLFRNKKTGKSQHFAFIEFESIEVAEIVVETMDNYLLLNHILKCKLIPESQVNPNLWKGTKKKFIPLDYLTLAKEKHNRKKTKEEVDKQVERLLKKEEKKRKRLLDLGIDYEFPEPEHKRFKE
ncbi:4175_t:CDS:2 [Entrophospora sp. SA101]|nr:3130_t:CDS:2 [Entrophospora sp. SA101]CAJ0858655.1 4175_t:CDS:2 [Entrophospora sp. SA101]CAJ0867684.1 4649_t:CDS:2 [Entrophospora sp. SA101]